MCVNEVEGEVVVNLLQGEIRMRMDGGISDYQIGTCISMGMWRYPVINNNRAITGSYIPSAGDNYAMHHHHGHLDSFNMSQLGKSAACPAPRLLLVFSVNITHPSFNNEFSGDSPVCTAKPARGE